MKPKTACVIVMKRMAWMTLDLEDKTFSEGVRESIEEHIKASRCVLDQLGLFDEAKFAEYIEFARTKRAERKKAAAA